MSNDILANINTKLTNIANNSVPSVYYESKLPNFIDDEVRQICEVLMELTPEQRDMFVTILGFEAGGILWFFGLRMTMLSVRLNSVDELLKGLVGFIPAVVGEDYRDILSDVSLFYNSALKLKTDPRALFTAACNYYPAQKTTCKIILSYLERTPEQHSIERMGYREVEGPSGLVYMGLSSSIPEGWQ